MQATLGAAGGAVVRFMGYAARELAGGALHVRCERTGAQAMYMPGGLAKWGGALALPPVLAERLAELARAAACGF
jgi:hypothetical protein